MEVIYLKIFFPKILNKGKIFNKFILIFIFEDLIDIITILQTLFNIIIKYR